MATEIYPSSYECDCGQESHFFENTIRDMKQMSMKKPVRISGDAKHTIVFKKGRATEIICPVKGPCPVVDIE